MLVNVVNPIQKMKDRPSFPAFLFSVTFVVTLCLVFDPRWATNDDVAMSMIAHGYGLAAYGSPYLVSSNVLWGYLVRAIPTINGVLGYSLATLAILIVIGWAAFYFLLRLGAGFLNGFLAIFLLVAQPTLISQFTVNAGLLTVAAVLGWQVYARHGSTGSLVAACVLAFLGYLIRDKEFLLVLGIALPLLPWRALRKQRKMQMAFLLLGLVIASAAVFDRWSYSGPEWQHFREFAPIRASIVDFSAGKYLRQDPELIARYGYSENDIRLIENWFFVDPQISAPNSLNAMLADLGPIPSQAGSIHAGFEGIKALAKPTVLPLLLTALLLLALMPRWPVAISWTLCLAALFAIGMMGRPGILRIYMPILGLLLVAPLALEKYKKAILQWMVPLMLFVASAGTAYMLAQDSWRFRQATLAVQNTLIGMPAGPIVSWANSFPFVLAFPVLANDPNSRNIRLYGLDSFTLAPFSVANTEQIAGRGMLKRLQTAAGTPIIALPKLMNMLNIYCGEHLNGRLRGFIAYRTPSFSVQQVRCEAGG